MTKITLKFKFFIWPDQLEFQGDYLYYLIPWRGIRKLNTFYPEKQDLDTLIVQITTQLNTFYSLHFLRAENKNLKLVEDKIKHRVINSQRKDYYRTFQLGAVFGDVELKYEGHQLFDLFLDFREQGLDMIDQGNKYVRIFFIYFLQY